MGQTCRVCSAREAALFLVEGELGKLSGAGGEDGGSDGSARGQLGSGGLRDALLVAASFVTPSACVESAERLLLLPTALRSPAPLKVQAFSFKKSRS